MKSCCACSTRLPANPIVAGTVTRAEAAAASAGSVGMKLKSLGLVFRLANWQFESLGQLDNGAD